MRFWGQSDGRLVRDTLAGRTDAFGELVRRHLRVSHAVALAYVGNRADAEDMTQEAFLKAYQALDRLDNPEGFAPWLVCIVRNTALTHVRTALRRRGILERNRPWTEIVESPVERRETERVLQEQVMSLDEHDREVILLHYQAGKSTREIAAVLGITRAAAQKRLQRARETLSRSLVRSLGSAGEPERPEAERVRQILGAVASSQAPWLAAKGAAGAGVAMQASGPVEVGRALALGGFDLMRRKAVLALVGLLVAGLFGWKVGPVALERLGWWSGRATGKVAAGDVNTEGAAKTARLSGAGEEGTKPGTAGAGRVEKGREGVAGAPAKAGAPAAEDSDTKEPAKPASISGQVFSDEAYPVEGARILVEVCAQESDFEVLGTFGAVSDKEGLYRVPDIDKFGRAKVYAMAKGYVTATAGLGHLNEGMESTGVDLELPRAKYTVSGVVVSKDGEPVGGARLYVRNFGYPDEGNTGSYSSGRDRGLAVADAEGAFEVAVLREGNCDLTVEHPGYAPGFFSRIPTGATDVRLELSKGGTIAGTVTTPKGEPVEGRAVTAVGFAAAGGDWEEACLLPVAPASAVTDAEGRYAIGGLGEDYKYRVTAGAAGADKATPPAAVAYPVEVRNDETTTADLVVQPLATIEGRTMDPATRKPVHPVYVSVRAAGGGPELGGAGTDADGRFTVQLALDKRTELALFPYYAGGVRTVSATGETAAVLVELRPEETQQVEVPVTASMSIPVRVVDSQGNPKAGIQISLGHIGANGHRNFTWECGGTTDASGRFAWTGLPAEGTHVGAQDYGAVYFVWASKACDDWRRGAIVASDPIEGQPGETVPEVVLVMDELGGIEGLIVDATGAPVAPAVWKGVAYRADGVEYSIAIDSDAQGRFVVRSGVQAGNYARLVVTAPDGRQAVTAQAFVVEGEMIADVGVLTLVPAGVAQAGP